MRDMSEIKVFERLLRKGHNDANNYWYVNPDGPAAVEKMKAVVEALEDARRHIIYSNEAFGSGPAEDALLAQIATALGALNNG